MYNYFTHPVPCTSGMKKEWILSDEEKQQKRAKIEENRAKKRTPSSGPASNNPSATSAVNSPQDDSDGDEEGPPSSSSPQPASRNREEIQKHKMFFLHDLLGHFWTLFDSCSILFNWTLGQFLGLIFG